MASRSSSSDIDSMSSFNNTQQQEVKKCKYCGGKIRWLPSPDGALREDGTPKPLPFNAYPPFDRHKCKQFLDQAQKYRNMPNAQKAKGVRCRNGCGAMIMFSEDQKSVSGKFIPLEMDGSTPHQCPAKEHQYQQQQQQQGVGGGEQEGGDDSVF